MCGPVRGLSFRGPRDLAAHAGFVGMLGAWPIVKVGACARPVFGRCVRKLGLYELAGLVFPGCRATADVLLVVIYRTRQLDLASLPRRELA